MESSDCRSVSIISCKFKINNLINLNFQISCNSIEECLKVFCLDVIYIIFSFKWLNTLSHQLINNTCCKNWFKMRFFIWFEFIRSIQMDTKRWHIDYSRFWVPETTLQLFGFFVLNNDLSSKSKISIEPCSPKTSTITLDIHLLESKLIINAWMWCQFQNWWISVTSNNLEQINSLIDFLSKWEGTYGRMVSCEVICLTRCKLPFITLLINTLKITYISLISLKPLFLSSSLIYWKAWKWETPAVKPLRILSEYSLPSLRRAWDTLFLACIFGYNIIK